MTVERVFMVDPGDFHGVRPYPDSYKNGWCTHCHRTWEAARKCSLKRWPNVEIGRHDG